MTKTVTLEDLYVTKLEAIHPKYCGHTLGQIYRSDTLKKTYYKVIFTLGYNKSDIKYSAQISFNLDIDLKGYIVVTTKPLKYGKLAGLPLTTYELDLTKLSKDFPEVDKELKLHIFRVNNLIKNKETPKFNGYLKVDEYTDFCGNFNINGEKCVEICFDENVMPQDLEDIFSFDFQIYKRSPYKLTRKEFFDLELEWKHDLLKKHINLINEYMDEGFTKPFRVHLSGTDDMAYSKYFFNKKEMKKEVNYLLKIQPINMKHDLLNRGYING